jgi:hypothetical protein
MALIALAVAPRRFGIDGTMPTVNAIGAVLDLPILQALFAIPGLCAIGKTSMPTAAANQQLPL